MSFKAFVWAWDQPLEKDEHLVVLLALADISNESGTLYASQSYIAKHARRNERTVRRALMAMDGTVITISERPGRTDLIRLNIPSEFMVRFEREEEHEQGKRGRPRKTLAKESENPGHGVGKPPAKESDEPKNLTGHRTNGAIAPVALGDEVRQAFDLYNRIAEQIGASVAMTLNDDRKRRLKARLKDCGGVEGWTAQMLRVASSPFLTGQTHHHFSLTLDFLLQPSSFTKLVEGQYHDANRSQTDGRPPTAGLDRGADQHGARVQAMVEGAREALDRRRRWSFGLPPDRAE